MRDEDEVQGAADKASDYLNKPHVKGAVEAGGRLHIVEYLRGVRDALDWVLDEDMEDGPLD